MGAKVRPENFKGNKNSGRKPFSVELAEALATGVANMIHNEELEKLYNKDERSLEELKTLVTPLTVKGIVEKKDITSGGEKIIGINYITPDGNNDSSNP